MPNNPAIPNKKEPSMHCPVCGAVIPVSATKCPYCGADLTKYRRSRT